MTFFNAAEPLLRFKHKALDVQDLCGLLRLRCQIGCVTLLEAAYTRIDQVFLLWGLLTGLIFGIAQFVPISWQTQAIAASLLTTIGIVGMDCLTRFWVKVEQLRWVVYVWSALMLAGTVLTDVGVFGGQGLILMNLCALWLGLVAVGYISMGVGMRSRTFILTGGVHLLSVAIVPWLGGWQILTTGAVMASSLFVLAELQWDMRPPIASVYLTIAEQQFNQEQQRLRQLMPR